MARVGNYDKIKLNGAWLTVGTGSPNGVVTGNVGDIFVRTDGGVATVVYVKESGAATNTGWVGYGGAGTGTVTSIGLTVPTTIFNVSGSPITASGSLTVGLINQAPNLFLAGPTSGASAQPTFRAITLADLPAGAGGGLTSVGLALPGEFVVTGTPLTSNGTISGAWASQSQNLILASPGSGAGTPTFRAMVSADLGTTLQPQFAKIGIGQAADANAVAVFNGQYFSPLHDDGNSGTALTVNFNNGNEQKITLTGNCTFTFSNPVNGGRYVIVLKQDATGSRLVTWPAAVKWPAGSAPTLTTAAGKKDVVTLIYDSTDGDYCAAISQNY